VKIPPAAAIRWTVGAAAVLAVSFAGTWRYLGRLERKAYDDVLMTTVEIGCEGDEVRQVGVEAFLWHTEAKACFPTLTRAEVELVGDVIFVSLFERCRNGGDAPMLNGPAMLPRYVFQVPVRWKRPGPRMYANEYAEGRVTRPRAVRVNPSCRPSGGSAPGNLR
jgi:hypothetical protein